MGIEAVNDMATVYHMNAHGYHTNAHDSHMNARDSHTDARSSYRIPVENLE